jgi:hypothetical protein
MFLYTCSNEAMKHRNIVAVIIFSLITFGFYDLYWLVKTKNALNKQTDVHTPTIFLLLVPYLVLGVLIGLVIGLSASHLNMYPKGSSAANTAMGKFIIKVFIAEFVGGLISIPPTFYWFFKFSKAINSFTKHELNTALTFILLWLLRFIGIAVIQDKFNELTLHQVPAANTTIGAPTTEL